MLEVRYSMEGERGVTSGGWAGLSVLLLIFAMPWGAMRELHMTQHHGQDVDGSLGGIATSAVRYLLLVGSMAAGVMAVVSGLGW